MRFPKDPKKYRNPECMAADFLKNYYRNTQIKYPINPFEFLCSEGISFYLTEYSKLEGVYIPASDADDIPIVGINVKRPITRQRYTAAHELCHHFRDADTEVSCPIGGEKNSIETFADKFAAAVLMPLSELKQQVKKRARNNGTVTFDDVLEIANYFGVSFESCLFRIAYRIHAIDGDTEASALKSRIKQFQPDNVRKARHITHAVLYEDLIDCYFNQFTFEPLEYAKLIFQNEYIYNDSRLEGLNVSQEEASEIVTDLRLNRQNSQYCTEKNEAFLSIAGHYSMYQKIINFPIDRHVQVYDIIDLNKKLFSYYPHPDFGGMIRQNNTLVLGTKFETVDSHDIYKELKIADDKIQAYSLKRKETPISKYIQNVVRTHHHITVIHPFADGNGRTSRAFMNLQLIRAGLPPMYIKADEKEIYLAALSRADSCGEYDELFETVYKALIRSTVGLYSGNLL